MISIAICEDEPYFLESINGMLNQYLEDKKTETSVKGFVSGEEFLSSGQDADIVLMDIGLPGLDGMKVIEQLRNKGNQVQVIFLTVYREYVFQTFDVEAIYYILKPIDPVKFFAAMDKAMEHIIHRNNNIAYEINDTMEDATKITFDSNVIGVIDHPNDCDYYKITATSKTIFRYSITSSDGYSLLYAGNAGSGAIYTYKDAFLCEPGTYYFAVLSESNKYSASSTYSINFKKIASISSNSSLTRMYISLDAGIVYQTNSDGSLNYVNGNYIDYEYSYYDQMSNSAGTQSYDIAIDTNAGALVSLSEEYGPGLGHYISSTKPYRKVGSRPVLLLTYYNETNFYKIHCKGTGTYSMNTCWRDYPYVTVVIDPQSGNLIDIFEPNYYYHLITVGNNEITVTGSYRWDS